MCAPVGGLYATANFKQFFDKINFKYEQSTIYKYQMKIMSMCTYYSFYLEWISVMNTSPFMKNALILKLIYT